LGGGGRGEGGAREDWVSVHGLLELTEAGHEGFEDSAESCPVVFSGLVCGVGGSGVIVSAADRSPSPVAFFFVERGRESGVDILDVPDVVLVFSIRGVGHECFKN
jgi:hypothetical protein